MLKMETKIAEALKGIGLPEKAASIYLALIGTRKMTVSEISRAAKIKRATCYQYLDQLLEQDFIIRVPVGKRMYYAAVSPHKVLAAFQSRLASFEKAAEEMERRYEESVHKPRVLFYEGKREIKRIYEDLFKTVGDVYSIFPPASFFENFTEADYDDFDASLGRHALTSRDLFLDDKHYKVIREIREKNGSDNKLGKKLPASFKSNVDVLIYSERVALVSLRDLSAIVIENKDIADLFRNMHQFIWRAL